MPKISHDEVFSQDGKVISSTMRTVTDEEAARGEAASNLASIPDEDLKAAPWGPMIADILRVLGYK